MTRFHHEKRDGKLRILVLGYVVRCPLGGLAWHHLQYALGLARLGHDVYFIEDSGDSAWSCYDPSTGLNGRDARYGLRFAEDLFARVGLSDRWAYYDAEQRAWIGSCGANIASTIASADLVLNVSGVNVLRDGLKDVPVRVLVDTDPVFNQIRHLTDPAAKANAAEHNRFFSFAENIIHDSALIPRDGFPWEATRQPVVLDAWKIVSPPGDARFTTVMQWDSYSAIEFRGTPYGMKSESFAPYFSLPLKTNSVFELSLGSSCAPRDALVANGWKLRNPFDSVPDPWSYQSYIQQSKAEFSVAKHGYVVSRCGWFSERSAAYLASGRPVVTQDTGFSDWMQTGRGILPFQTFEGAVAAVHEVNSNYAAHSKHARAVADAYFDSTEVLTDLVERAMTPVISGEKAWAAI